MSVGKLGLWAWKDPALAYNLIALISKALSIFAAAATELYPDPRAMQEDSTPQFRVLRS